MLRCHWISFTKLTDVTKAVATLTVNDSMRVVLYTDRMNDASMLINVSNSNITFLRVTSHRRTLQFSENIIS